jgi:hypothetical protein
MMWTRRRSIIAGAGLLAAVGLALNWRTIARKHYPPTPYDDLLSRLADRDWAAKFGVLAQPVLPGFTPARAAARLRTLLGNGALQDAALRDARTGAIVEVAGWQTPESVALMAALAASQAP